MVDSRHRSTPTLEQAVLEVSVMLRGIVSELISFPERLEIHQVTGDNEARLTLYVDASDLPRAIGADGRTQRALSAVVVAVGRKAGFKFSLAIEARKA